MLTQPPLEACTGYPIALSLTRMLRLRVRTPAGPGPCTACPAGMDTARIDGVLGLLRNTSAGTMLPAPLAAQTVDDCQCAVPALAADGTLSGAQYRVAAVGDSQCAPCPAGAVCDGRPIVQAAAMPGYWRARLESAEFTACPNSAACAGVRSSGPQVLVWLAGWGTRALTLCVARPRPAQGVDSACAPGYVGPLCAQCAPGAAAVPRCPRSFVLCDLALTHERAPLPPPPGYARPTANGAWPPLCALCVNALANWAVVAAQAAAVAIMVRDAHCLATCPASALSAPRAACLGAGVGLHFVGAPAAQRAIRCGARVPRIPAGTRPHDAPLAT